LAAGMGIKIHKDPRNMQSMREAFEHMVLKEQPKCPIPNKIFPVEFPIDGGEQAAKDELTRIVHNLGF
jgi:hypothetical protein